MDLSSMQLEDEFRFSCLLIVLAIPALPEKECKINFFTYPLEIII